MATEEADTGRADDESALRPQNEGALDILRYGWGDAYEIGHDDVRGWWASRRDRIGGLLAASGPEELRDAITGDYAVKPVPRDPAARASRDGGKPVLGADPGALLTESAEL